MSDGVQVGEGDGTRPFKPRKQALKDKFALWVSPHRGKETWDTRQPGNRGVRAPRDGWGVWIAGSPEMLRFHRRPSFLAERMEDALAWAKERYSIAGWERKGDIHYAIPGKAPKE